MCLNRPIGLGDRVAHLLASLIVFGEAPKIPNVAVQVLGIAADAHLRNS